jgi:hypothetical protein
MCQILNSGKGCCNWMPKTVTIVIESVCTLHRLLPRRYERTGKLMRLNVPSSPSLHSSIRMPSPRGRGMELTMMRSTRFRPASRRARRALAAARDCGEPRGYSPGFGPVFVAPRGIHCRIAGETTGPPAVCNGTISSLGGCHALPVRLWISYTTQSLD